MRLFTLFLLTMLAACSIDRDVARTVITPPPDAQIVDVMIATTREPVKSLEEFGRARSDLGFASYAVSIPPGHKPGRIEWPRGDLPDPRFEFSIVTSSPIPRQNFRAELGQRLASKKPQDRGVFLFIHGYNNSFGEGLYATAQIYADYQNKLVPMHFSWSSAARTGLYAYDQDSALFARDALTELLSDLASNGSGRLEIIAHSMGAFVLMEALRQMPKSDLARLRKRMGNITLLSPDLDIDVFTSQLKATAPLPQPFYVLASRNDLILKLSTLLRGGSRRVGLGVEDFAKLRELGVIPIDVTSFSKGGSFNHQTFNDPDLISTVIALTRRNPGRSPSAAVIESFVADLR